MMKDIPSLRFHAALEVDDTRQLQAVLDSGQASDSTLATVLGRIAYGNKCLCLAYLLDRAPHLRDARQSDGETAIGSAAKGQAVEATALLIQAGANVNNLDDSGWPALGRAAIGYGTHSDNSGDRERIMRLLIEAGVTVNDKNGLTCLVLAAVRVQDQMVKLLLDSGAPVSQEANTQKNIMQQIEEDQFASQEAKNILTMLRCASQEAEIKRGFAQVGRDTPIVGMPTDSRARHRPGMF